MCLCVRINNDDDDDDDDELPDIQNTTNSKNFSLYECAYECVQLLITGRKGTA